MSCAVRPSGRVTDDGALGAIDGALSAMTAGAATAGPAGTVCGPAHQQDRADQLGAENRAEPPPIPVRGRPQ